MITDRTAHALARDLASFRAIVHAALDVIAEQQRTIAQVTEERDNVRTELQRYIAWRLGHTIPSAARRIDWWATTKRIHP